MGDIDYIEKVSSRLSHFDIENPDFVLSQFLDIMKIEDGSDGRRTVRHSLNVGEIMLLLAKKNCLDVGCAYVAGLLHVSGKCDVGPALLNFYGEYSPEMRKSMEEHVIFSYNRLKSMPLVAFCAKYHHPSSERKTYPNISNEDFERAADMGYFPYLNCLRVADKVDSIKNRFDGRYNDLEKRNLMDKLVTKELPALNISCTPDIIEAV